jgi:hypothetical protein
VRYSHEIPSQLARRRPNVFQARAKTLHGLDPVLYAALLVVVLAPVCSDALFSACLRRNASEMAFRPAAESLRFFVVGF